MKVRIVAAFDVGEKLKSVLRDNAVWLGSKFKTNLFSSTNVFPVTVFVMAPAGEFNGIFFLLQTNIKAKPISFSYENAADHFNL